MSQDVVSVIGQEQWDRVNLMPEKLLLILNAIETVNKTPLSIKELQNSIALLDELGVKTKEVYASVTKEQQKASIVIKNLAQAEKARAEANLKNTQAAALQVRVTIEQTEADRKAAAQAQKVTDSLEKKARAIEKEIIAKKKSIETEIVPGSIGENTAGNTIVRNGGENTFNDSDRAALKEQMEAREAMAAAVEKETVAENINTVAVEENLTANQILAETLVVAKMELSAVNLEISKNAAAFKAGSISEEQYIALASELTLQQAGLKGVVAATTLEINQQTKLFLAAETSADALAASLVILKRQYRALTEQQKASPVGIALNKQIGEADEKIKAFDKTIGESQRNVGNYSSAFKGVFSAIRQIAYIVPGIGIAGIFNLAFEAVNELTEGMFSASKAAEELNKKLGELNTTTEQEIAKLQANINTIQSSNTSNAERSKLIDEINKKYPEHLSYLTTENDLTIEQNANIQKQIDLIRARYELSKSQEEIAASAKNLAEKENELNTAVQKGIRWWQDRGDFLENVADKTKEVTKAQKEYEVVLSGSINPLQRKLENEKSGLEYAEKTKKSLEDLIKAGVSTNFNYQEQVWNLDIIIKARKENIAQIQREQEALSGGNGGPKKSLLEIAKQDSDTRLKLAKDGSAAELSEHRNNLKIQRDLDYQALLDKYKQYEVSNKTSEQFNRDKATLDANYADSLEKLNIKSTKTNLSLLNKENSEENKLRQARIAADKEMNDAIRDHQHDLAEENIQTNKAIYEDTTKSLDERLEAYAEYYSSKNRQDALDEDKEKADLLNLQKEIVTIEAKTESTRSIADKALLMRKEVIALRLANLDENLQSKIKENAADAAKAVVSITKSASDQIEKELQERLNNIESAQDKETSSEIDALIQQLKSRQITYQEFANKRKDIEAKGVHDETLDQIGAIDFVLSHETLTNEDRVQLEKKKSDLIKKLRENDLDHYISVEQKKKKEAEETRDAEMQAAVDSVDALANIYDAISQGKLKNLDIESEKNKENLQKEIDGINASAKTQKEKDQDILDAQQRAAIIDKRINDDKRKQQISQAKTDKAIGIMNIILATALAEIKAFTEGDPYTKIPRAIAAGAAGATALAIAIAAPIPQYAKGTENHPGGLMIVGDGGEPELITHASGKKEWSPDTDTLMYGAAGTKVTPLKEVLMNDILNGTSSLNGGSIMTDPRLYEEITKQTSAIEKLTTTMENQPGVQVDINEYGIAVSMKKGDSVLRWSNSIVKGIIR